MSVYHSVRCRRGEHKRCKLTPDICPGACDCPCHTNPIFEKAKLLLEQKINERQNYDNYEASHGIEDDIAQFVLDVIASETLTIEQAKTLANMVLEDLKHDNPRWYA